MEASRAAAQHRCRGLAILALTDLSVQPRANFLNLPTEAISRHNDLDPDRKGIQPGSSSASQYRAERLGFTQDEVEERLYVGCMPYVWVR